MHLAHGFAESRSQDSLWPLATARLSCTASNTSVSVPSSLTTRRGSSTRLRSTIRRPTVTEIIAGRKISSAVKAANAVTSANSPSA